MINAQEEWRRGYAAGYMYGRIDGEAGAPYDARTPLEKKKSAEINPSPSDRQPRSPHAET